MSSIAVSSPQVGLNTQCCSEWDSVPSSPALAFDVDGGCLISWANICKEQSTPSFDGILWWFNPVLHHMAPGTSTSLETWGKPGSWKGYWNKQQPFLHQGWLCEVGTLEIHPIQFLQGKGRHPCRCMCQVSGWARARGGRKKAMERQSRRKGKRKGEIGARQNENRAGTMCLPITSPERK